MYGESGVKQYMGSVSVQCKMTERDMDYTSVVLTN